MARTANAGNQSHELTASTRSLEPPASARPLVVGEPRGATADAAPHHAQTTREPRVVVTLTVCPSVVTLALSGAVIGLAILSLLGHATAALLGEDFGYLRFVNLDDEGNLPTWFESVMLLVCALLLAAACLVSTTVGGPYRRRWAGLMVAFLGLSLLEVSPMYRPLLGWARGGLHGAGWPAEEAVTAVALALALGVLIAYGAFLWELPPSTRRRFVAAGAIYVGGAVALDWLAKSVGSAVGYDSSLYVLAATAEEVAEMAGLVIFMNALLGYLGSELGGVRVRIGDGTR